MNLDYEIELRDAIFGLHTRRFGTVAEIMVKKIINGAMSKQLIMIFLTKLTMSE